MKEYLGAHVVKESMDIGEEDGDFTVCLKELRDLEGGQEISDVGTTVYEEAVRGAGAAFVV